MTRRTLRYSLIAVAVPVLALLLLLYTPFGLALVGRLAAPLTDGQVRVEGLGGFFPGRLHVIRLEIADSNGVWLRVEDAGLEWSAWALLNNHVAIDHVAAARIAVLRRPLPSQSSGGKTPRIDIAQLSAPQIALSPPVIGHGVTLSAQGSLHFVSLSDVAANLVVTRADNSDRYRIAGGIQGGIARGSATISEGADGILGRLVALPGLGPVNLRAQAAGDAQANTIAFQLSAGPLTANGHGTIALASRHADIDATLAAPAMTPRAGMSWQALSGVLHLHGRFDAPQVRGDFILLEGHAAGLGAKTLNLTATGDAGHVALEGTAETLTLPGASPNLLAAAPLRFTAQIDLQNKSRPVRLSLTHPVLHAEALAQTAGPLAITGDLTLPSLAPFSAMARTTLAGSATLHVALNRQDTLIHANADGIVQMKGAGLPARLLGKTHVVLTATMMDADITASHLTLDGAAVKVQADGTLRRKQLAYRLSVTLTDLSRLTTGLQGALTLKGTANGTTDKAQLMAEGSALLAPRGHARQRVTIALKAEGLPALSAATLTLRGHLDGAPLSLHATLTGDKTRHAKLAAHWRSLEAQANLAIANGALDGTARLNLQHLANLAAFTGTSLAGAAQATIAFHHRNGKADADIDAGASALSIAGAAIQAASLHGAIADIAGSPNVDLALSATHIAAQGWSGDVQAKLHGPADRMDVALNADMADAEAAKLHAHGIAQADIPHKQLLLTALDGTWRALKLSLDKPTTLQFANGLAVEGLAAHLGKGRIAATGRLLPELSLTASAEDIALADFGSFLPGIGPQGTVSGAADLHGSLTAPSGRTTITGRGLRAAFTSGGMPAVGFTLNVQLMGDHGVVDASMDAGANAHLTLAGTVPLRKDGAMALHAAGKADLALLDAFTAASGRRIRGTLTLEGDAAGTFAVPRLTGRGSLANGEIQDYAQGLRVRDIAATFASDGTRFTLGQLTAHAGTGTLTASGTVDLTAPDMPVAMTLEMQNARPVVSDLMTADLSGSVALSGHVKTGMTLAGTVRVTGATINLPENFPPEIAVLNVRRRGQPPPPPAPRQTRVQLDLAVRTNGPVFVRGHGMDADMGGNLHVAGTTGAPAVSGSLRMNRGSFSAAGQTLTFTSGEVRFDGMGLRGRLDPALNFVAQTVSGGVTATFTVTGYASSPRIALSSTPQLPQDEVVAHLLFQQSVKQLGPLQLASIAQAAAAMGGIGGGFNPLSTVRRTLGLDRLSVGSVQGGASGTENQTTVEAGRYVTRNVYVGVRQNLSGGTQTQVQVDITRQLKAQATLSTGATSVTAPGNALQDNGSSVGLSYQFEY